MCANGNLTKRLLIIYNYLQYIQRYGACCPIRTLTTRQEIFS